jgi:hypothetical protein
MLTRGDEQNIQQTLTSSRVCCVWSHEDSSTYTCRTPWYGTRVIPWYCTLYHLWWRSALQTSLSSWNRCDVFRAGNAHGSCYCNS